LSPDVAAWYAFLEAECRKTGGLLCFYDRCLTFPLKAQSDSQVSRPVMGEDPSRENGYPG
jgi:hypothetical protein